jgi:hypothetical protein
LVTEKFEASGTLNLLLIKNNRCLRFIFYPKTFTAYRKKLPRQKEDYAPNRIKFGLPIYPRFGTKKITF